MAVDIFEPSKTFQNLQVPFMEAGGFDGLQPTHIHKLELYTQLIKSRLQYISWCNIQHDTNESSWSLDVIGHESNWTAAGKSPVLAGNVPYECLGLPSASENITTCSVTWTGMTSKVKSHSSSLQPPEG